MKKKVTNIISICLLVIVSLLSIFLVIKNIFFFEILVVGDSMRATLKEGEMGWATKEIFVGELDRQDIVIFTRDNREIIKRVIGKPNDHIKITREGIFVNNEFIEENYVTTKNKGETYIDNSSWNDIVLGEGQYFVLGDNRANSYDSRFYGPISREDITGKLTLIYARGDCTDPSCDKLINQGFVPFRWY